jgi:hypothetical protein
VAAPLRSAQRDVIVNLSLRTGRRHVAVDDLIPIAGIVKFTMPDGTTTDETELCFVVPRSVATTGWVARTSFFVVEAGGWQSKPMTSPAATYHGYGFPPDIISHVVWLYHRFYLSFRDSQDLLAQRGITVSC